MYCHRETMKKVIFAALRIRPWTWHLFSLLAPEVIGDIFALSLGQLLLWGSGSNWLSENQLCCKENLCIYTRHFLSVSLTLLSSQFMWWVSSQKSSFPLSWWHHGPHLSGGDTALSFSSSLIIVLCPQSLVSVWYPADRLKRVHVKWEVG